MPVLPMFAWVMIVGVIIAFVGLLVGTWRQQWGDMAFAMMVVGVALVLVGAMVGFYETKYPLGGQNIGRLFYFLNAESILSSVFSFPITNAISTGSGDFCLPDRATRNGQYTNPLSPVFSLKLSSTFLNLSFPSS
ncbi:MAG: hypothetical protein UW43_C0009G0011 [Candidatus Yanofskybacteria bacterium GW2011_GWA1_44_21]|uniref:Uncharacterized protein n=1 Tax=Candidatus Yanofskybacteria bacterium GW2011_GWB1_45_11 TaxID=1619026 RepID=A0A0G1L2U4_9BACT|nr:MAG: hypothetical protein UW43_C0009G0011 [Candidatus Yanofskybacteria bacterium GW2011_GWA1_44_21]KKT90301.1 MAG: hypothetical protein UW90_C0003G0025 [Candidatus Yanofskybacteria bacterium GW2011_GWB1_45_11]